MQRPVSYTHLDVYKRQGQDRYNTYRFPLGVRRTIVFITLQQYIRCIVMYTHTHQGVFMRRLPDPHILSLHGQTTCPHIHSFFPQHSLIICMKVNLILEHRKKSATKTRRVVNPQCFTLHTHVHEL